MLAGSLTREAVQTCNDPGGDLPASDAAGIIQVKVWLLGISPMVWRRMQVVDTCSLRELHGVIQVAMGWEGIHLYQYQFCLRSQRYGSWEVSASSPEWWHAAVRFEHALQAARGLGVGTADTHFADEAVRGLERTKWRLWHGRGTGCRRKLAALCRWAQRKHVRDLAGIGRLERHVSELLGYLERNQGALVHYAARRRRGEPISTAFVESAANEIIAKRMNKAQQMRWSRATVQPFLDVRTAVLNDTLDDVFRYRHPGFRPANDDHRATTAAA